MTRSRSLPGLPSESGLWERIKELARRIGVVVWIRQSSEKQVRNNPHSAAMQRQYYLDSIAALGAPQDRVIIVDGLGEQASKSGPDHRQQWQLVRQAIRTRRAGVVVLLEAHRATRNMEDGVEIIADAREFGALFYVAGQPLDPDLHSHRMLLHVMFAFAENQVASTTVWNETSRFTACQDMKYLIPLPAGMTWLSFEWPHVRERLQVEQPDIAYRYEHAMRVARTSVRGDEGASVYAVPYPDRDVLSAVDLTLRWLFETESVDEVLRRIRAGFGGYPKRGSLPSTETRFGKGAVARWVPAQPGRLVGWLKSPALYGIYATYHAFFLRTELKHSRRSRHKGLHYPRAVARLDRALPNALELLRADPLACDAVDDGTSAADHGSAR